MDHTSHAPSFDAAVAAARRGDLDSAIDLANRLLERNPRDANALQVLGLAYARQRRLDHALDAFLQADAIAPNHPPILNSIGKLLKERGDLENARSYLERATRLAPDMAEAHFNLADLLSSLGDRDRARAGFQNALKINPRNPEFWGLFSLFLEQEHDLEKAHEYAKRALTLQPRLATAHMALAEIDARRGDYAAVVKRIENLLTTADPGPVNTAKLCGMLARALEKLGRYDESFAASSRANRLFADCYAEQMTGRPSPRSPESLAKQIAYFETCDLSAWTRFPELEGAAPIFLLGFPRSGTTLLDQILSTYDDVAVLEEKGTLADAGTELIVEGGGLEKLARLTREQIREYRRLYWRRVDSFLGAPLAANAVFVDKLPMHTAMLGVIYRIFPDARIIFALRDPRDVVLSCFQQTFGMNVAMYQFLDLEGAARYYDQVMRLARACREKLPLRLHEVRYENVVTDFRGEVEPLLSFLGLEWRDDAERFFEKALTRNISTPSAKQVIHGLYKSSIGKWRRYETQMKPVLPMLQPWARAFGYDGE